MQAKVPRPIHKAYIYVHVHHVYNTFIYTTDVYKVNEYKLEAHPVSCIIELLKQLIKSEDGGDWRGTVWLKHTVVRGRLENEQLHKRLPVLRHKIHQCILTGSKHDELNESNSLISAI